MAQQSLVDAVRQLSVGAVSQAGARLKLLGLELAEERERVIALLVAALTACFFVFLAAVFGALLVVVHYWDTPQRLAAVLWLAIGAVIVAVAAVAFFIYRVKQPISIFSHSLGELEKDQRALETIE
ncbi:phage holin family protein [Chitinasiproducens palmae]|uniref:Uncharacterized membrane protein YqjE n=1 Tax=Chitinasiproducens palmae TaxID=1770053 RepID=A0A1H2PMD6_9BURK|nr:phage holin family protein [Chitinasiproducens palmae]SDV47722.1 Uncharacterized membrane protein YqjE [Chitinasiproducens palmae]